MFDLETDTQVTHWWLDIIRWFFAQFDKVVYWLLMIMYEVFFNIADAAIISSDTIRDFYSRIQLIIGVFMIFKVSVSLMQAVMDPDRLTNKDNGMGKIISRIIVMLAMFTAIIPLNIPYAEEGTYNAYLNENGLLFGTLYSLQSRIVGQNVIGKLLIGNVSTNSTETSLSESSNDILNDKSQSAKELATFILKTFVRINLKKGATEEGATNPSNYMCSSGWGDDYKIYASKDSTPNDILSNDVINDWCTGPNGIDDNYSFVYTPIISTICGAFVVVMLFGFCIDIAVRALKMAVLRLIAPIPIISYIDPKSSKEGAFASWVKALTSTYLDLFLRLIIIFFALFCVQSIIDQDKGLDIPIGNGTIGLISVVFIIIGIFYFARMAPKFIKDTLGLKGSLSNFGLSGMMAAAGAIRAGGNARDALAAARNNADMQVAAFNQGKQAPGVGQSFTSGEDYMAQELTGNDKMTYKQMKRGERYLDREGLTAGRVESAKNDMYRMQDEAAAAKNQYDRFTRGEMTDDEMQEIAMDYGHYDENTQSFVMSDEERRRAMEDLQQSYLRAQADAGRQEALYKDMQAEMDKRGGSRNSYRAKHGDLREVHAGERDIRLGDLFSQEGRDAVRTGVLRETVRNVTSIPRNERLARSDRRNAEIDEAIDTDRDITNRVNENMDQARRNRNGGGHP